MSTVRREGQRPSGDPADLLQRLVCFVASALDVRFAFVAGLSAPRPGEPKGSVAVWLARDYGLRFAFGRTERPEDLRAEARPYEDVLRRLWPAEPDLVGLMEVCGPARPVISPKASSWATWPSSTPGPPIGLPKGSASTPCCAWPRPSSNGGPPRTDVGRR